MAGITRLLVMLEEDSSIRLELSKGIPSSVDEAIQEIKNVLEPVEMSVDEATILSQEDSIFSVSSDDTLPVSSPSSGTYRKEQWPKVFVIPTFSHATESQLSAGNAEYQRSQVRLTPSSKILSDILETLMYYNTKCICTNLM